MTARMTARRRFALEAAAQHPKGNIDPRGATASDERALEDLGYADSICDHGHVRTAPDPGDRHRGCPHFFRITDKGRRAVEGGQS